MTRIAGASCLVTGGSSGIGRGVAELLARRGGRVMVVGRNADALEQVASRLGGSSLVADLAGDDGMRLVADAAADRETDILVSAAGVGMAGALGDADPAEVERLIRLNLLAPIVLARSALPGMQARHGGHIVAIASIVGHTGHRGEAVYAASKAGLIGFSDSLREECAGTGVYVSVVSPGVVETPFFERRGAAYDRRWPRPIPASRVAGAVVQAIEGNRAEVIVPGWLQVAVRLRGAAPGLYRSLASRFG